MSFFMRNCHFFIYYHCLSLWNFNKTKSCKYDNKIIVTDIIKVMQVAYLCKELSIIFIDFGILLKMILFKQYLQ